MYKKLRSCIENSPANPKWIVTVRGAGYKFNR
ncbi:MAG: winged helix-turn-helix domain-containing protein [Planctomycetota bacterium]